MYMGKEYLSKLKADLLELLKAKALKRGRFVLSSGKVSSYYLDGRITTLTPKGAYLIADIILETLKDRKIDAIGGPTIGADPIVGAIACLSHIKSLPLQTFIVRKSVKGHGMQKQIEGPPLRKGSRVILVDDVATTGGALIEAKEALEKIGIKAKEAIVVVDRLQGAASNLKKAGMRLESIFKIRDLGVRQV
ncbi:MAG: orotate phosphoribosyltransferase [Candidatus Omnitrophota bacterium]